MSEMIDRMAVAIANARSERRIFTAQRARGGPNEISLEIARLDARAALQAQVMPTQDMVNAGAESEQDMLSRGASDPADIWVAGYQAGIYAALKEDQANANT